MKRRTRALARLSSRHVHALPMAGCLAAVNLQAEAEAEPGVELSGIPGDDRVIIALARK